MAKVNIANELSSLPLDYIISAPMLATIKSQSASSRSTYDFIREIGFVSKNSFSQSTQVKMVDFILGSQNAFSPGPGMGLPNKLSVPLLSLVQVPFLRVNELDIDFNFDIKSTALDESKVETKTEMDAEGGGFLWVPKVSVHGSVTTVNESKTSVDKEAVLKIHVKSTQDQMPVGLEKVLSIFGKMVDHQTEAFTKSNDDSSSGSKSENETKSNDDKSKNEDDDLFV